MRITARLSVASLVLLAVLGCSRTQRNDDFVPPDDAAQTALRAYLDAWAAGHTAQEIPGTKPQVRGVDERHLKGRTLKAYKVLGPVPADAPLCYAVQLTLGGPEEVVRERYVVVGMDPLWVWRYDDYLMMAHWAHPMPDDKNKKAEVPKR